MKSKTYQTVKEDGIKYSAGTQYTINLPANVVITEVVFSGYDNYAEADSYVAELNGQSYNATDYVFPMKVNDNYVTATQTVKTNATGKLTFTPGGKQVVWAITLKGSKATGVNGVSADKRSGNRALYNIAGQKVNSNYKGFVVKDGKKYIK